MKKLFILLITFTSLTFHIQAQEYSRDSLFLPIIGPDGNTEVTFLFPTFVEMHDSTLLTRLFVKSQADNRYIGDWFYKVSPKNNAVIDSAFLEVDNAFIQTASRTMPDQNADRSYQYENGSRVLLAQDPLGDDYIYAYLVYNSIKNETKLRIRHFDDDLNFENLGDAVLVHLEDLLVDRLCNIMLEGDNIILMYLLYGQWDSPILVRVGLDGTLREKTAFPNLFQHNYPRYYTMAVFNDSPREYAFIDMSSNEGMIQYDVIDSLFVQKETIVMETHYGDIYLPFPTIGYTESFSPVDVVSLDDRTFLEVRQYERHGVTKNGACIMKYDKETHEYLASALFNSWPVYTHSQYYGYPIGLKKSSDGNLYFAYRTNANNSINKGWIGIAKLDTDLNIIWQRYCLGSYSTGGYLHTYCRTSLTSDGFVIGGKINNEAPPHSFFCYFIHDESLDDTPETESFIRPYMFYPNPTQDQLHLQFSPDATPLSIELYDLQGRLVHIQTSGWENINMKSLSAGQYLLKVKLNGGKVFTDKIVKN